MSDESRKEFEAWARTIGLEVAAWASGHYASAYTNGTWSAWQAATRKAMERAIADSNLLVRGHYEVGEFVLEAVVADKVSMATIRAEKEGK